MTEYFTIYNAKTRQVEHMVVAPQPAKKEPLSKEVADEVLQAFLKGIMEEHKCDFVTALFIAQRRDDFSAGVLKGWENVSRRVVKPTKKGG